MGEGEDFRPMREKRTLKQQGGGGWNLVRGKRGNQGRARIAEPGRGCRVGMRRMGVELTVS